MNVSSFSSHRDAVFAFLDDLESEALVEEHGWIIRRGADRDRCLLGIRFDQLGQKCGADTTPAQTGFDNKGEFRWRIRLIAQSPNPNGTEQFTAPSVVRDKAGIPRTTPTGDITRELRTFHSVPWRSALGCMERLIQHLPQDRFIRSC